MAATKNILLRGIDAEAWTEYQVLAKRQGTNATAKIRRHIIDEANKGREANMTEKSPAALMDGKDIVGYTVTAARNGEMVSYGRLINQGGPIQQQGRAKISRAKRNLQYVDKNENVEYFDVNRGGGSAI